MFARTPRLTLRPAWPEDAAALTRAAAYYDIAKMLARLPWPYEQEHAEGWLSRQPAPPEVNCLILSHGPSAPELIGVISIMALDGRHELGYWLTPSAWGRGYATEAGEAMLGIARHALGLKQLHSRHFLDNPASERVLTKLGFRRTGQDMLHSVARDGEAPCATLELDLAAEARAPVFSLAA